MTTLTFALTSDSGTSASDGISQDGAVSVTTTSSAATWEYSVNSGSVWTTGSGSSFTLSEGSYAAGAVQVRQTLDSVVGDAVLGSAMTIDSTAPTVTVSGVDISADTGTSAADFLTYTAAQTITGTLSSALASGDILYGSVDNGSTWTNITSMVSGTAISWTGASLSGSSNIVFEVVDAAGNTGSSTGSQAYVLDVTAPTLTISGVDISADTGTSAADFITYTAAQTITGTLSSALAAGDILYGSVDNGSTWTNITSMVSGTAISWTGASLSGSSSIVFEVVDAAGNIGSSTGSQAYVLDVTAPTLTVSGVEISVDDGSSAADFITDTAAQTITATLSSALATGDILYGSVDKGSSWTDITSMVSSTTISWTGANLSGSSSIVFKVIDAAGNTGSSTGSQAYVLDLIDPTSPTLALTTDSGTKADSITNSGLVTVSGQETGATLEYCVDGATWSSSFVAVEGANVVQVRQTDVAGNVSVESDGLRFTLDTQVEQLWLHLSSDTGIADDKITSDASFSLHHVETGATIEYSIDGGLTWTSSFKAIEGDNQVQARQTDAAGNVSTASNTLSFTLDRTIATPTLALDSDTGSSSSDGISSSGKIDVSSIESGASWRYSTNSGNSWTRGESDGFVLDQGSYAAEAVQVEQTDIAGNVSSIAKAGAIRIDQTKPAALTLALASDTGLTTDNISSNGLLLISGQADNATVQYSIDGSNWTSSFSAIEGNNAVWVHQTDLAGNVSEDSGPLSFTLDMMVAAPTMALVNDTATAGDQITSDPKVRFDGLEDGATVQYSLDGGKSWISNIETPLALVEGTNPVMVHQTDVAGNISAATSYSFTLDNTVATPALSLLVDSGVSSTDGITNNKTLVVVAESGAIIEYSENGSIWRTEYALSEGSNSVFVRQTDAAGNQSPASNAYQFTVDTEAAKLTLSLTNDTDTNDDHITTDASLSFVGLEDGATLQYSIDDGAHWTATFKPRPGNYSLEVRQTDAAGNVSAASDALSFTFLSDGTNALTDLLAYSWKTHSLLNAVDVNIGTTPTFTDSNGAATTYSDSGGATVMTVTRAVASSEAAATNEAVNLQDAIAILKMIVGLPVNASGQALSPYQAFAADYDGNGKVELSDAISVLKHVVGLAAPAPQWMFFNEVDSNVPGDANLNPGLVPALTIDSIMPSHIGLVGVLRGDVDGSFAGTGMPVLTDSRAYFTDLVTAHPVLSLAQFGVYPLV